MRLFHVVITSLVLQCCLAAQVHASEFGWLEKLESYAQAEPSAYRDMLAARFKLGDGDIRTVFNNVERPSEAYMILRLGEMSDQLSFYVIHLYHFNKGWTALADKLEIDPGSSEFRALLAGHDLQIAAATQNAVTQQAKGDGSREYVKSAGLN